VGITAYSGPLVTFGITQTSTGQVTDYNDQRGPSLFDLGQATMDPRYQYNYGPGGAVTEQVFGLWDQQGVIDYVPFAGSSATGGGGSIAASSTNAPVAGTALTLNALSSLGAFATTIIAPESGLSVSVIAIDSTASTLNFGQSGTVAIWNPSAGTGRCLNVINSSNANSEVYIVNGRDMYGFKMTESISASTTSTGTQGQKAFKYIQSVTPSTATTVSATGVSVGFADKFGMPLYAPQMAGISVWVSTTPNNANPIALSSNNTIFASTVATMTAITGDVRGIYFSSIATNGTSANGAGAYSVGGVLVPTASGVRVTIYQPITPMMAFTVTPTNTAPIFGTTQFSNF
jgi:hypothetical protein